MAGSIDYRLRHPGTQPELLYSPYVSSRKRAPTKPLIEIPHTISEITGPIFCAADISEGACDFPPKRKFGKPVDTQTRHALKQDKFVNATTSGLEWVGDHRANVIWFSVAVALVIASCKAFLVAGYFMHLVSEKRMIYGILGFTAFFFVGLMGLTLWSMADFPLSTVTH